MVGPISIKLEEPVRDGIKALADADERSLSSTINRILRDYLAQKAAGKPRGKRR